MEPNIAVLDEQIKQTDTVKSLHDRDDEIVKDLEDLKDGQINLNDKVEQGFEKGRKRMDSMEKQITDGFKQLEEKITTHTLEGKQDEIKKLNKRLDAREQLKNGIIIALVGGIMLYLATFLIEKAITPPEPQVKIVKVKE